VKLSRAFAKEKKKGLVCWFLFPKSQRVLMDWPSSGCMGKRPERIIAWEDIIEIRERRKKDEEKAIVEHCTEWFFCFQIHQAVREVITAYHSLTKPFTPLL
jgi:hypothetical protein